MDKNYEIVWNTFEQTQENQWQTNEHLGKPHYVSNQRNTEENLRKTFEHLRQTMEHLRTTMANLRNTTENLRETLETFKNS